MGETDHSLSAFLVRSIKAARLDGPRLVLSEMLEDALSKTEIWWREHPGHERDVEAAFEKVTGLSYSPNRTSIIRAYASHYVDKAWLCRVSSDEMAAFVKGKLSSELIDSLWAVLQKQSALIFVSHFGSVDFIPPVLAAAGFPISLLARFRSEIARSSAQRLAACFGAEIIDLGLGLPASVRGIKDRHRLLITACDAFHQWRRSTTTVSWLDHAISLDRTPCDLVRIFRATPFFLALEPLSTGVPSFRFHWKSLAEHSLSIQLFDVFRELVVTQPWNVYNWEDFHELWSTEPHVPEKSG